MSKTSSQRPRDLRTAQRRPQEIQKQNETNIRQAERKQELGLELQEFELQKLRKHEALRVEELEDEIRRTLAQATSAKMEHREGFSEPKQTFMNLCLVEALITTSTRQSGSMIGSTHFLAS